MRPAPGCLLDPTSKCAIFGASKVFAQIEGSLALVHGPKGCAFPAYEATLHDPLRFAFTEVCERAVIHGGEDLLEHRLQDACGDHAPDIVGLISSCSTEIIGDDIRGVIRSAGLRQPVVYVEGAGFKRDQWQCGESAMVEVLRAIDLKAPRADTRPFINLIGHVGAGMAWQDEVESLARLLRSVLGLEVQALFCRNKLEDFRGAGSALATVLVSPRIGAEAAAHLRSEAGVPVVAADLPLGLEKTVAWLDRIADVIGHKPLIDLVAHADTVREKFRIGLGRVTTFRPFEQLQRMRTCVAGDPCTVAAYLFFLRNELEVVPELAIVKAQVYEQFDLQAATAQYPGTQMLVTNDSMEIRRALRERVPELLFGNDFEYMFAQARGAPLYVNIAYPGARRLRLTPRPYLGFTGVLHLLEDILNAVTQRQSPQNQPKENE